MRYFFPRYLMLLVSMAVVAGVATAPSPASAADCGGATKCICGDTVTVDHTLTDDPITTATCPGTGLIIIDDNVTLDLGGKTLRGSDVGVGVDILGTEGVTVQNGRVVHFRRGIRATNVTTTTISDIQVLDNAGAGITLEEDGGANADNVVDSCIVRNNGGDGVFVIGDTSTVTLARIESNGGTGLTVEGLNNKVLRNIVHRNLRDGIHISGAGATADRNQAKYSTGEGVVVEGANHTLTLNISNSNGTDGFTVSASNSRFERNTASYNGRAEGGQPADGYGIRDTGAGNAYSKNNCTGNGLGNSLPTGLCN